MEQPVVRPPLLLFPCNGNSIDALDAARASFDVMGFVDDDCDKQRAGWKGMPVYARTAFSQFPNAFVLALPGNSQNFRQRTEVIKNLGLDWTRFIILIHPKASVSAEAELGRNVCLLAGVVVSANVKIGRDVLVLPNTVIHHDVTVGDGSIIGSSVVLAGGVQVGKSCYIGSATTVFPGRSVGDEALLGMASNAIRDVAPGDVVAGNPAKQLTIPK